MGTSRAYGAGGDFWSRGIYLNGDPSLLVEELYFAGDTNANFNLSGPLVRPTEYLADYLGDYQVTSQNVGYLSTDALEAEFTASSISIAPVPEPGAAALAFGGIATFCLGGGAVTRWKKRRLRRTRTAGEEPAADLPPSLA